MQELIKITTNRQEEIYQSYHKRFLDLSLTISKSPNLDDNFSFELIGRGHRPCIVRDAFLQQHITKYVDKSLRHVSLLSDATMILNRQYQRISAINVTMQIGSMKIIQVRAVTKSQIQLKKLCFPVKPKNIFFIPQASDL